ncbi:MAG: tripartite tricarboxylate transporter permease [Acidiferrobacterales bacterium]
MADFLNGTQLLFTDPIGIVIFIGALIGGLVFGAVPGLSLLTLAAILLPFTAWMSSTHAIMLYGVIYVSGVYGGAVTAILFNIPGSVENAPTAFDGYPMTRKGQSGKAIGYAVTCSAIGGTLSAIAMMAFTGPIADFAVSTFGPAEIFALVFFGLSIVAGVGTKSLAKGWLSLLIGLLIGSVGTDPIGGIPRFSMGTLYLLGGISFIPLILGFFAVTEVFIQGQRLTTGTYRPPKVSVAYPSMVEFWRMKFVVARSAIIGFFAGVLPGIGATLAAFLSYNEAVRWSKHPERFGTGEPEGVVAPETANNAATGAAMIPLLALGLPGGALTAMMIGVFNLHDMDIGPLIMVEARDLVWVLFASMFWASLAIIFLGVVEAKGIVNLLRIPFPMLGPGILLFSTIGAYALRNNIVDVYTMFIAGIIGYFMRRRDYSIPALVMGVILGQIGEAHFARAMVILDYNVLGLLQKPIAAVLIALGLFTIVLNIVRHRKMFSSTFGRFHVDTEKGTAS